MSQVCFEQTTMWSFAALNAGDTTWLLVHRLPGRKLLLSQSVELAAAQENSPLFNSQGLQMELRSKQ